MKIILTGVETNNKGAELMLYAILQEIERKWKNAIIYISKKQVFCDLDNIRTKLDLRFIPCEQIENMTHMNGLYRSLHLPFSFLPHVLKMGHIDYLIDGSGFAFSDQFNFFHQDAMDLNRRLASYKQKGTKIIYLPQAFGPFDKPGTKEVLSVLGRHAEVLMPREKVSLQYISKSGLIDMGKVKMYTDFTSLIEGEFPSQYAHLKDGICIIPNHQMINKGIISFDNYMHFLNCVINKGKDSGHPTYLLNHGGKMDENLCVELGRKFNGEIEIVSGLDALKVKGLISTAYLVISSRYHGVASSLNSCVPCLATSWSHKYKELFNDYGMADCIMPVDDEEKALAMIDAFLNKSKNEEVRQNLSLQVPRIKNEVRQMWNTVWEI